MVDRNLRSLWWSIAAYYLLWIVAHLVTSDQTGRSVGEAISAAAGTPLLFLLLFFGGVSVINVWIAWGVVIAALAALILAFVRLRGMLRIAAVLAILTAMMLYGGYIGARVGA